MKTWLEEILDTEAKTKSRQFALGMIFGKSWTETDQGYEFWKAEFDSLASGKDLSTEARNILEGMKE